MIEQGSPEWHAMRLGKATASRISDVMAKGRSGAPSATRANYLAQLVSERLTGVFVEGFESPAMAWGKEVESQARAAYAFYYNVTVEPVAFVDHPTIAMSGSSPDGLIGDDGLVQFKCPNTAGHIATLLGGSLPGDYLKQVMWEMACTGRHWCDVASFDPRLPEEMKLHVRRVDRDPALVVEITAAVVAFLKEVDQTVGDLTKRYRSAEAA